MVLLHGFTDWRVGLDASEVTRFREIVDSLAKRSYGFYRDLVHERPELFTLFRTATPIAELADARFGSRPAYRPGANAGIDGIRAIPWAFGWTQIRLMLTGWLGVGTALSEAIATEKGSERTATHDAHVAVLRRLSREGRDGLCEDGSRNRADVCRATWW